MITFSVKKATTARISSQVFSARKEMACPAALKIKLMIEPMRPGRREAIFLPISFRLFPRSLPTDLMAFVIALITALITVPAAKRSVVKVPPHF